jgi:hypothetical protein
MGVERADEGVGLGAELEDFWRVPPDTLEEFDLGAGEGATRVAGWALARADVGEALGRPGARLAGVGGPVRVGRVGAIARLAALTARRWCTTAVAIASFALGVGTLGVGVALDATAAAADERRAVAVADRGAGRLVAAGAARGAGREREGGGAPRLTG